MVDLSFHGNDKKFVMRGIVSIFLENIASAGVLLRLSLKYAFYRNLASALRRLNGASRTCNTCHTRAHVIYRLMLFPFILIL